MYEHQAEEFKSLLNKKNIALLSNVILRKSERFKFIKEKIKKYFGEIYYVEGDYNYGRLKKLLKNGEAKFLFTQLHWEEACILLIYCVGFLI